MNDIESHVQIGVCCMAKKLKSKPMQNILGALGKYRELKINEFDENMILNEPVENWPKCDVIICFYSSGFPIEKTLKYMNYRKPIQINDLES